jgi:hypothetical protein
LISGYYYQKQRGLNGVAETYDDVVAFVRESQGRSFLNQFPRSVTKENFRDIIEESFVTVGLTEELDTFLYRASQIFGQTSPTETLPHLNKSERNELLPAWIKDDFKEQHRLEYDVYEFVQNRFGRK